MIAPEYIPDTSLFPIVQRLGHCEREHVAHCDCDRRARCRCAYSEARLLELMYRRRQEDRVGMRL
jgi:hypothetical protein